MCRNLIQEQVSENYENKLKIHKYENYDDTYVFMNTCKKKLIKLS